MRTYGRVGPAHPRLGAIAYRLHLALSDAILSSRGVYRGSSLRARDAARRLRERIALGETVYLLGLAPAGHNSGAALVEVSNTSGVRLISNEEEERYGSKTRGDRCNETVGVLRFERRSETGGRRGKVRQQRHV